MNRKKDNASAQELWQQVFSNLAKDEFAALVDPAHRDSDDEARMAQGLRASGWTDRAIEQVIERTRREIATAPKTSPGVNPFVEAHLARLCDLIEMTMDRLKLDSHAKVARGVEPRAWATAAKINVVMTDQSIITVSAFLFRFCGLIARAFLRTIRLDPFGWDSARFDLERARNILSKSPETFIYWFRIYMSFALSGTHVLVPYKPSTPGELIPFEHIALSMELFVIAHEYGHHHCAHGKNIEADPHKEEFEADQFALRICGAMESHYGGIDNPYLRSGAGGVILLYALQTLRAVEGALGLSQTGISDTHPTLFTRLEKFDSVAVLRPRDFEHLKSFRTAAENLMSTVQMMLLESYDALPTEIRTSIIAAAR
ncbi:hypothetical protein [Bradyrhizobium sp. BR 1433]|uniref:hypothetical protein n=1 Tax=Bradyrhizobium sp. BR 1433 TaxID=3447967 RepID=UPI003EE518FD